MLRWLLALKTTTGWAYRDNKTTQTFAELRQLQ